MSSQTPHPCDATVPLSYAIAGCSAHSGRYVAENILVNKSSNQTSRWSGAYQGNVKQWILLKLDTPAVLKSITFGKYFQPHPCNMKEFKIHVGMNSEHMTEVLHSGLKNDSIPETFLIKYANNAGICFPTLFVKIEPMSAHGQNFNTSIWYVSMTGITDETFVEHVRVTYDEYRETAVLRHVLKHLRQRRLLTPYDSIISHSGLQLEHPLITQLHESIVLQGNWRKSEQLLPIIAQVGLFDSYVHGSQPYANWKRLRGTNPDGDVPSSRGGHAMCIDPVHDMIYLFGGWDGKKSLDDFWEYSVKEDKWRILSHSTSTEQNAPGARSCHKMVFDTKTGSIYVLGRLSDSDAIKSTNGAGPSTPPNVEGSSTPPTRTFCSEFYRYHTRGVDSGKWDFLSFDTASSGGPPLVFDHQMVMDSDAQILYVFGGRVVDGDWDTIKYSSMYSYNVRSSKWTVLQQPDDTSHSRTIIPPRFGHSMVLDPSSRTLYIFAGQRDDKYLSDMFAYDIATNTATELFSNFTTAGGPDACFTQRAVIDPELRELYVFCGLTRSVQPGSTTTLAAESPNWTFAYATPPGKWTRILPQPTPSPHEGSSTRPLDHEERVEQPLPRYAHQVVYNPKTKTVFTHGGNAGIIGEMELKRGCSSGREGRGKERRLDDLWQMNLIRTGTEDVIRRATYKIRQHQFREMCEDMSPVEALNFLQNDVFAVVNHNDPVEAETFRSLLTFLLSPTPPTPLPSNTPAVIQPLQVEDSSPLRKHSRSDASDEAGRWTSELHLDNDKSGLAAHEVRGINADTLREIEDPVERGVKGGRTDDEGKGKLTSMRFGQRNDVFESLLEFVSEGEKQPKGSLLDLIDGDGGRL